MKKRVNPKTPLSAEAKRAAAEALFKHRRSTLLGNLIRLGVEATEEEYKFSPRRNFRFDFAWPVARVGLEIDGGIWNRGAHGRGAGILRDQEKGNLAVEEGWRILRAQPRAMETQGLAALVARVVLGGRA